MPIFRHIFVNGSRTIVMILCEVTIVKKRWLWVVVALSLAIGLGFWMNRPTAPTEVETVVLTSTKIEHTVSCNGVLEATDGMPVFVPVACRIQRVCVTVGQRVNKGDVLAVIDKEATIADAADVTTRVALAAIEEELVAPEDGIVAEISAEAGKTLKLGTPCVLIVRPGDVRVRIAIREKDLPVLQEGMRVHISGDGLDKTSYSGVLSEISCTASTANSSTVVAGVVTPDQGVTDTSFRLGITAKVAVITAVTESGYLVPYEAVLADQNGSYFYVITNGAAHIYRADGATQTAQGLLLTDEALADAHVITQPERVGGDGASVKETAS